MVVPLEVDDSDAVNQPQKSRLERFQARLPRRRVLVGAAAISVLIVVLVPILVVYLQPDGRYDLLDYVHPLIGTIDPGHAFAGATVPYGMVKAVADSSRRGSNAAGYVSDTSSILGFSHLHDSGTGSQPSLGNFPIFAHPGCPDDDYTQCAVVSWDRELYRQEDSVKASIGYFALGLENNVFTEVTTSAHAALYRFTFPDDDEVDNGDDTMVPNSPFVLVDLTDLQGSRYGGNMQVDPATGRMTGNGTFRASFSPDGLYSAHYCIDFDNGDIRQSGIFVDTAINGSVYAMGDDIDNSTIPDGSAGTWVQFDKLAKNQELMTRVGISFISVEQACINAENEIPDYDFKATKQASRDSWREKLSYMAVDERNVADGLVQTFWSGLYRSMLSPQNYTGENQAWNSSEPYYDSFYCLWDTFRTQHPLLTIVDPDSHAEMIRSLLDIYKHEGKLPDCRMSFSKGYMQGGSNADVVLADAYVKNLEDGIDWDLAFEAVISDAEIESEDWEVEGRGNLDHWHKLGYIPYEDGDTFSWALSGRTVSRTVEYAYDDFAVGLLAHGLGKNGTSTYMDRSRNWKNLLNPNLTDPAPTNSTDMGVGSEFIGFLQPKRINGNFVYQHPRLCSPLYEPDDCFLGTSYATYESSSWLYSFYVPQDMASLISSMGGAETFVNRLDHFHEAGLVDMGNEPAFLTAYQFHYAGRPGRSAWWTRQYIPTLFNGTQAGVPGNDDSGAMGAFAVLAMMGTFPVAGQDVYLLSPPFFREVSLRALAMDEHGRRVGRATIRNSKGFDSTKRGDGKNLYIQKATLNGEPYTKNWIGHGFFVNGGTLEFELGPEESDWGTRDEDLPPSLSTAQLEDFF